MASTTVVSGPPRVASRLRADSLISRDSLLALAAVGALVEFLALRVITRIGEFLPGDGWRGPLLVAMYFGLAALNVAAIAAALATLDAARALASGGVPARFLGVIVALAVGLNLLASVPGLTVPVWPRAVVTIVAFLGLAVAPDQGVNRRGAGVAVSSGAIFQIISPARWRRTSSATSRQGATAAIEGLFAPASVPIRLAMAAIGLALLPELLAGGGVAEAGTMRAAIEALAIGAALSAPLAVSRRPGRGAIVAGVAAAALALSVILRRPTTAASFAMWSLSFALWLPAPVYALASGTLAATLFEGSRRAETRRIALALALVALAGVRPEATYPALMALAAGTAAVRSRPELLATPE